jgi:cysteine desulfurase
MVKKIYLDNAASTPVDGAVLKEVERVMRLAGNPSSYNDAGREAARVLNSARLKTARFLGAKEDEIVFVSSGTEANNLAVFGAVLGTGLRHGLIVTTPIEHPSVTEPVKKLGESGFDVRYLAVDERGLTDSQEVLRLLNSRTVLVSVMYANNEIGTIQPIVKIGKAIKEWRSKNRSRLPLFHVDACQAAGYLDMNVNRLGADLLTFNGSKIYGPRGTGVLYVRNGVRLEPQLLGGSQENGLRAGTENLPAIAGMAKALDLINEKEGRRLAELRDFFIRELFLVIPDARLNGPTGDRRLPNNVNISVPGLDSESMLIELDKYGIRAGSGSACTARAVEPSHVLKAIGVRKPYLDGVVRFSLGRRTSKKDIRVLLEVLPKVIVDLRERYGGIVR